MLQSYTILKSRQAHSSNRHCGLLHISLPSNTYDVQYKLCPGRMRWR
jgi:hypothetical protein